MAGVTSEAKSASERLPDRISIGVLARTFSAELLDEVIDAAGVREVRSRLLPARLMMVFTLACWLFMRSGYGLVLAKLVDAHAVAGPGWGSWQAPSTGSITKAKARLGPAPLKLLFDRIAGPVGAADTPGVFYAGLRVLTVDGFTLDVPDTPANAEFFGRGASGSSAANPYPQLRALALAEAGTRALLGAVHGPSTTGEQTLAWELVGALGPGMVVLADRNFASWKLWRAAAGTGAQLCWRLPATFTLPVRTVLPDGTYLSQLRPRRTRDGEPITVRVIEYSVLTTDAGTAGAAGAAGEEISEISEVFALATTLLDPHRYPAAELAALYHDRWQAETAIADLKTTMRGGPETVLRSQSPTMVAQEFWAMLCVYQAIRDMISYAAPAGLDPGRVSFTRTLDAARDSVTRAALSPHKA